MDNNMYDNNNNGLVNGQFGNQVAQQDQVQVTAGYVEQPRMNETVRPVNYNEAMNVTGLMDLQSYAKGTVVRFPDFAEGQPFVARVRRPSMLVLAKQGKIPNSLLKAAGDLFANGGTGVDTDSENMLGDMYNIMDIVATAALVQPSMTDIKNSGIELSDDQMMAIFNYTQMGVKALDSFRKE